MDHKDFARMGAAATNKLYTTEKRKAAAKKGWLTRKKNEKKAKPARRTRKA